MHSLEQIQLRLKPFIESLGYKLWLIEYHQEHQETTLRLLIDHFKGISLEDCMKVHQRLQADKIGEILSLKHRLEISSPGIFRPLKLPLHFQRFEGKQIRIQLREPIEGFRKGCGILVECLENGIRFQKNKNIEEEIIIIFQNIQKANLEPELTF